MYFSAFVAMDCKHVTIKSYLASIRHLHIINGFPLELTKFLRLQLLVRGIKRVQGNTVRPRRPITLQHLKLFHALLNIANTCNPDSLMLWASMTLAFFGFLRLSELTCNGSFDQYVHLAPDDISFFPNQHAVIHMIVRIKASKTDPFRTGITITVGKTDSHICPVSAMLNYLSIRPSTTGPLFIYASGRSLSKSLLISETRQLLAKGGLREEEFAGHSFRIGAATSAAAANTPAWLIKVMGRWSSDCFERYIHTPASVLAQVSKQLVNHHLLANIS